MRAFSAIALIAAGAALAADDPAGWSKSRWGMTEHQLVAALPDLQVLPHPEKFQGGVTARLGIEPVQIGGTAAWRAYFLLPSNTLESVRLRPADSTHATDAEFQSMENLLVQKYGRPFERSTTDEGRKIRTAEWTFPTTVITLTYTDLTPRLAFRSLWLTYAHRSHPPGNL